MAQWDFAANLTQLLDVAKRGEGPRTMAEIIAAASAVAAGGQTDPTELRRWFDENAEVLIGQQLLVMSVHSQRSPETELPRVLREWRSRAAQPTPSAAVDWLKAEYPGLLRAWLLTHVAELVATEMDRSFGGD